MSDLAWVPRSCTLPSGERPLRVAEWDALLSERLTSLSRPQSLRIRLSLAVGEGVEERVRDLVARESGCCSFFTFTTTTDQDLIDLEISVDRAHEAILDGLAARIAVAGEPR
ncbi:hypothetical protein ACWEP8_28400 [Streptomyces hydrogenans]